MKSKRRKLLFSSRCIYSYQSNFLG